MKRILTAILALMVVAALLVLPAMAAGDSSIQLSSNTCAVGETVEVIYSISGYGETDTIGITYNVPEGLKLESAEWLLEGGKIADVDKEKCHAAWAGEKAIDLSQQTPVFKLTYTALEESKDLRMQIRISAIVKKGATELGTTTAEAEVVPPVSATAVKIPDSLALDLNGTKTATLTATLEPAEATDEVQWSCDNSGVIEISQDGKVTALKKGTATVTATAGSASKTCTVTVTCSHHLTETKAKEPSCTQTGNNQYFTCDACGVVLAADKKTETTVEKQTLPMQEHTYSEEWKTNTTHHWHLCTVCSGKSEETEHEYKWVLDKAPSADATGVKHEECTCGVKRSENTEIPKLTHAHENVKHYEAVDANCVQGGNVEYWTCGHELCEGKYYADEACALELESVTLDKDPDDHDLKETAAKAPTCKATGNNQYFTCINCGVVLAADKKTETTAEKEKLDTVEHSGGTATCTELAVCQMCDKPYGELLPHTYPDAWTSDETHHWHVCTVCQSAKGGKAEHSFQWITDQEATEDAAGVKHEQCDKCGYKRNENTEIPKMPHVHVDVQHNKAQAATCVKAGNVEYWTCGSEKCEGKFYADEACTKELETVTVAIDPDNHALTWVVDQEATEEAAGSKHQVCSRCEKTFNEGTVIEQLQHAPALVEGKEPTCTEAGIAAHYLCQVCGRYYAYVDGQIGEEITLEDTVIGATGHTHGEQWVSDAENHWHECSCGDAADQEAHQSQVVGAVDATETEDGYTGDTVCSVCGYVIAAGETIPALGTEETEPTIEPTQEPETKPSQTEPDEGDGDGEGEGDEGGLPWVLLLLVLALVAVGAAIVVLVLKKKNKK